MFNESKIVMVTLDPLVVFGPKKKNLHIKNWVRMLQNFVTFVALAI